MKLVALTIVFALAAVCANAQDKTVEPKLVILGIEGMTAKSICSTKGRKVVMKIINNSGIVTKHVTIDPYDRGDATINPAVESFTVHIPNGDGKLALKEGYSVEMGFPDGQKQVFKNLKAGTASTFSIIYKYDKTRSGKLEFDSYNP